MDIHLGLTVKLHIHSASSDLIFISNSMFPEHYNMTSFKNMNFSSLHRKDCTRESCQYVLGHFDLG